MRVVIVKVGRKPLVEDIPEDIKSLKKIVGGILEIRRPYQDQTVGVITSPENETMNRWIVDEDGQSKFIAKGDFILCKVDAAGNPCGFTARDAMQWKFEIERL